MSTKSLVVSIVLTVLTYAGMGADKFIKPNSSLGMVTIVNDRNIVGYDIIDSAVNIVRESLPYSFKIVSAPNDEKAQVVIQLVAESNDTILTVSPEAGRAKINVAAIGSFNREARIRREILRAFAFSFGAGASQFQGNIMSACDLEELDSVEDFLPFDTIQTISRVAEKRGLKPEIVADYYTACQEGWAPMPTTAEEQKIWDEIHEIPSEPIKIIFERK